MHRILTYSLKQIKELDILEYFNRRKFGSHLCQKQDIASILINNKPFSYARCSRTRHVLIKVDELQYHPFKVANIEVPLSGFELKGSVLAAPTQAGIGSLNGKVKYEPAKIKMQLLSELNAIWNSLMATGQVTKSLDILIYNARNLKYQIRFQNITVTSVATSIDSTFMTDEVIFLYTKLRWSIKDKSLGWDLEKNKIW